LRVDWEFLLSKKERMRGAWTLIGYLYLIIYLIKKNNFLEINLRGERIRIYKRKGNDNEI